MSGRFEWYGKGNMKASSYVVLPCRINVKQIPI